MNPLFPVLTAAAVLFAGAAQAERLTEAPLVDAAWLAGHLGNESLVVIDVRDPVKNANPYAAGHIPGAISAPYAGYGWRAKVDGIPGMLPPVDNISARIGALGVSSDKHVVIVPQGSDSSEFGGATRVYWTFKVLGHDAVSILDGGQNAWVAAGGAVETDAVTSVAATFTPAFRPELLATTEQVAAAIDNEVALVDGRPPKQFRGEEKPAVARVAGTIPTSVNIDQGQFYSGTFASADAIGKLRDAAGLTGEEETIAFCNTGHWASIAWFGLSEIAGQKNVSMYDGSMAEWTLDEKRPVK